MSMPHFGKTLIILGLITVAVGVLLTFSGKIPWIGRLPGDVFIRKENFSFYMPLTTSIILSIVISLLLWLLRK